jgi:outer membrane biosynthesis protein TonB
MMNRKLFAGLAAFGIYFAVLATLLYYFGFHHQSKPQHFVEKNEKGIAVTLAGAKAPEPPSRAKKSSAKKKRHPKPRNITQEKKTPKRTPAKKKAPAKPQKKPDAKKLFSKVKVPKKKEQKKSGASGTKRSQQQSIKKSTKERGVENAYLAKVERLLKGWPAQANFAGQEIDVWLKIYPSGNFEYKVLKLSGNPDFNHELINYLKQLQRIGFGPHSRGKPYEIEVQFVAHE